MSCLWTETRLQRTSRLGQDTCACLPATALQKSKHMLSESIGCSSWPFKNDYWAHLKRRLIIDFAKALFLLHSPGFNVETGHAIRFHQSVRTAAGGPCHDICTSSKCMRISTRPLVITHPYQYRKKGRKCNQAWAIAASRWARQARLAWGREPGATGTTRLSTPR